MMAEILNVNPFDVLSRQIADLASKLDEAIGTKQAASPDGIHTVEETCSIFNVTKPTLHSWNKQGKIKSCRIGGRVFYKRSAIDAALQLRKFSTH